MARNPASHTSEGIVPFRDEHSVVTVGEMTVENRTDRVTLHGGVDLTRDHAGLERARRLRHLLDAIVTSLEGEEDLPEAVAIKETTTVRNPFG